MGLSVMKAARVSIFEYLQNEKGYGWWGDEKNESFYEGLSENDPENPWNWIKVETITDMAITEDFGFDHAGKSETSFLSFVEPKAVDFERRAQNTDWFARAANDATPDIGKKMVERVLERLRRIIK